MKTNKPKERKQPITMNEIAQLAGVSQSTVSRVLNGNAPVAPEKYAAVMALIERLNYHPNMTAQGLVNGKTSTIGILTRHMGSPFFGELLRGITIGLRGSTYHPVIGLGNDTVDEDLAAVDFLLDRRVDALILLYSRNLPDDYLRGIAATTPVIIIGSQVPGLEKQCVTVDNVAGGYIATRYLLSKGHRDIAHITGDLNTADAVARREGYIKAILEYGITPDPELIIEGDFAEAAGILAINRLLVAREQHPFSAIFAANDQMAYGARLALYQRQIDVPNDISLIGYDDLRHSEYMTPPLTTIRQPVYYMGLMSAQAILSALAGQKFVLSEFPVELVARQSVTFH